MLLGLLLCAAAVADTDLFVAEAAVENEDSDTRNAALSRMLGDVLVRISGSTGIAAQPAAKAVLDAAPSLVQQYRYRTSEQDDGVQRVLWARFEQSGVERMMREQGLPVWRPRPRVLLWLATEQGTQRALLNLDNQAQARDALRARAAYRGMPLQLPLMDLEDQSQLAPADVWSDYQPTIRQASARYPHDLVVTGRLTARSDEAWQGAWALLHRDGIQTFETPPQRLSEALPFAVDQIQNLLAARFAPLSGSGAGPGTLVRFTAVHDLAAYARLVNYLQDLSPVSRVALRDVRDDSITIEIGLRGSEDDLRRAFDAGAELIAEPGGRWQTVPIRASGVAVPSAPTADMVYRLRN